MSLEALSVAIRGEKKSLEGAQFAPQQAVTDNSEHFKVIGDLVHSGTEKGICEAALYVVKHYGKQKLRSTVRINVEDAQECLWKWVKHTMLDKGNYQNAASILWSKDQFNSEPRSVKMIWDILPKSAEVLIPGAGSLGKSYSVAVWLLLDWLRDPEWTCVKVLSSTEEHAKRNVFAHIKNLHRNAIINLPGREKDKSIQVNEDDKQGIHLLTIPAGQTGKGRLRGFHPVPRGTPHALFGVLSRVRAILDEAEEIPEGVWEDVDNILITKNGVEHVKVICATNPKDRNCQFAKRCEPENGWESINIEDSEQWRSRLQWDVIRLDGARCENVVNREVVYEGFLTWTGYQRYLQLGDASPEYHCTDLETEVLSKRGWIKGGQCKVGDVIYTLNTITGLAEWKSVQDVFISRYDGEMVNMESRHMNALVTPNHKWPTTNKDRLSRRHDKRSRLTLKETKDIRVHDLIPLIRESKSENGSHKQDSFAAIIGWVITDGTFFKKWNRIAIYQSPTANGWKCKLIRDLLNSENVKFQEAVYRGMMRFTFSGEYAKRIRLAAPNKKLTIKFIESLNDNGRKELLESMILGDGGFVSSGNKTRYVCTKDEQQSGVYAALMARCGYATRTHKRVINSVINGCSFSTEMFYVNMLETKYVRNQYIKHTKTKYNGKVWCPTTENGTFLARRKGFTYFTGNTMARGWWPETGLAISVIPQDFIERAKGEFIFTGKVTYCASADLAFEGLDLAPMTIGRFGKVIGWKSPQHGSIHFKEPRYGLQIEQQFMLQKNPPADSQETQSPFMARQIQEACENLAIPPRMVIVDRTGNGTGVHDILKMNFGPEVVGLHYGEASSNRRIMEDDSEKASDLYDGVVTELFFATRKFCEFDSMKLGPMLVTDRLIPQLTDRRYKQVPKKKLVRVESKKEYKSRGKDSPDEADSLTMLVHLVRMRTEFAAQMLENSVMNKKAKVQKIGVVDSLKYIDFE